MDTHVHAATPEQTEALVRESAKLAAALKRARQVRLILFLVVVLFAAVAGWTAIAKANEFASPKNLDRVTAAAVRRLEQKRDYFHKQLEMLLDKVTPRIQDAMTKQATKDTPLYLKTLEKERAPLISNLEVKFAGIVSKRYEKLRPHYERILKEEFPQSGDRQLQERMLANLDLAMDRMFKKYLIKDFQDEVETLAARWEQIPPAAAPRPGEQPLEDQFLAALLDLMVYRLTHNQTAPF